MHINLFVYIYSNVQKQQIQETSLLDAKYWLFLEVDQISGWPNFWRPFGLNWPTYILKLKIIICVL